MAEADLAVKKWPRARGPNRARSRDRRRRRRSARTAARPSARCCKTCSRRWTRRGATKDAPELERQMRLAQRLSSAAFNRTSEAWQWYFEDAASEVKSKARDSPRAQRLVGEGKTAIDRGDNDELRRVVKALVRQLLPGRQRGPQEGLRLGGAMDQADHQEATTIHFWCSASRPMRAGSRSSAKRRSCSACSSLGFAGREVVQDATGSARTHLAEAVAALVVAVALR